LSPVIAAAKELGIAVIAYSQVLSNLIASHADERLINRPLGRGFLTGSITDKKELENNPRSRLTRFKPEVIIARV
jgi:hypothetical protein